MTVHRALFVVVALGSSGVLAAEEETPESVEAEASSLDERLEELAAEVKRLRSQVRKLSERKAPETSHLQLGDVRLRFGSYVDVGLFKAFGDGVAYVRDPAKQAFPEFQQFPWVFSGDPWANPVNSQGDSADLGLDRTNVARFDPIRSGGKPSFLVNLFNLTLVGSLGESLLMEASVNFEPRSGLLGSPGDFIDMDLAYFEWIPFKTFDLHVFVGKFESTFGIEYRQRKAVDRYNVTPSLIARYTVGTPIGVKARASVADGLFNFNVAVTNGGTSTERFSHFYNEIDRNFGKTGSARVGFKVPTKALTLELGLSGLIGPQDDQPDDRRLSWQIGADAKLVWGDLTLRAEYIRVRNPGGGFGAAPWLRAEGFYVDGWYQVLSWLGVYARADHRSALLFAQTNLYVSNVWRGTFGVRFDINFHLAAKVEYLRLWEVGGPEIDDDVLTSSVVFKF